MLASEMVKLLQIAIQKYGDKDIVHEDNECSQYTFSNIIYDEDEDAIRVK